MPENSVSFSEFPTYTTEEWIAKIEQDLKGRSLEDLDWQLEADWRMSPFSQNPQNSHTPIRHGRQDNNWAIGAIVSAEDAHQANDQVLQALLGGVNAPLFKLPFTDKVDLYHRLAQVDARMVALHFELSEDKKEAFWTQLQDWAQTQGLARTELRGSIAVVPSPTLAKALHVKWPAMRSLQIDGRPFQQMDQSPVEELAQCLLAGVNLIKSMEAAHLSPSDTNELLFFSLGISRRYFLDIAKLRALRILWANVLGAYALPEAALPPIHAFVNLDANASMENNMIRSGTQAMAAAIGGADTIFLPPADLGQHPEKASFTQRIARNVQHLLQMESKLDRVVDPAAGSYLLEKLTDELSERAWARFVELSK